MNPVRITQSGCLAKGDRLLCVYQMSFSTRYLTNSHSYNGYNSFAAKHIDYPCDLQMLHFGQCLMPQVITCITGTGDYCTQKCEMHHIIDRETREEIFTYYGFSKPSVGVEEIPAEQPSDGAQAKPKDNKMYDLNGREIRNPLPGMIYILNGEKHVAK